jgi:hypothetical protein
MRQRVLSKIDRYLIVSSWGSTFSQHRVQRFYFAHEEKAILMAFLHIEEGEGARRSTSETRAFPAFLPRQDP